MFILLAIKPPQLSLSKWRTLLSEDLIQEDTSVLFCPSLCGISPIVFLKGCNWTTFLPGTLTPVASPASVEQILAEKTKLEKSWGLIVAIAGFVEPKPGAPQSKYTWLPTLRRPLTFCLSHQVQEAFRNNAVIEPFPARSDSNTRQEVISEQRFCWK